MEKFDLIVDEKVAVWRRSYITVEADSLEEATKIAFDNNAIVRIVSQDGNLVLHKENISIYLGRIATSRLLENVTVVDATGTTNKISSIRVREIYKKR